MTDERPPFDPVAATPAYVADPVPWVEGDHPTHNPDGVTVSNVDYTPKTQEEKAKLLGVQMVEVIDTGLEPYPEGANPQGSEEGRKAMLARVHSPMELVEAKDRTAQTVANLAAGGSVEGSNPGPTLADQQRDEGSPGTTPGGGTVA